MNFYTLYFEHIRACLFNTINWTKEQDIAHVKKGHLSYYKYMENGRINFIKDFNTLYIGNLISFIIADAQKAHFDKFYNASNLSDCLLFEKHQIQNLNYPDSPPQLHFYLFKPAKDFVFTIDEEKLK